MVRTVIYTILLAASTAWFFYPLRGSPLLPEQKVKQQMIWYLLSIILWTHELKYAYAYEIALDTNTVP